jgi:3-deoxy-manno-octulosonate cytidylyltransferase (CMP-KDO synthetase)
MVPDQRAKLMGTDFDILAVIPARYASTRFPGKPLVSIAGKPMIQHVVERAREAPCVTRVIVATDDERILQAVESFGGEALLTRSEHRCGTERVAEVAARVPAEIYVNVQGDEPLIEPAAIEAAVNAIWSGAEIQIGTLAAPLLENSALMDPNVVKAVTNFDGVALYFSRAPIPWLRDASVGHAVRYLRHIGLYAFRREALLEYPTLPPGELELAEQLEQLRWLENGYAIRVVECEYEAVSVDVPGDVARVEQLLNAS